MRDRVRRDRSRRRQPVPAFLEKPHACQRSRRMPSMKPLRPDSMAGASPFSR